MQSIWTAWTDLCIKSNRKWSWKEHWNFSENCKLNFSFPVKQKNGGVDKVTCDEGWYLSPLQLPWLPSPILNKSSCMYYIWVRWEGISIPLTGPKIVKSAIFFLKFETNFERSEEEKIIFRVILAKNVKKETKKSVRL